MKKTMILALALAFSLTAGLVSAYALEDTHLEETQSVIQTTEEPEGEILQEDAEAAVQEGEEEAQEPAGPELPQAALLNGEELNPIELKSPDLDKLVRDVLDEIIQPEMDTYEQVKACYDYLVDNMSYGWVSNRYAYRVGNTNCNNLYYYYGELYGLGAVALTTYAGQCSDYSAAFVLMTRMLGLDSHLIKGTTPGRGGAYVQHYWAEINLGDGVYVFDPQLEQSLARWSDEEYAVFCKTYEQMPGRYASYRRID